MSYCNTMVPSVIYSSQGGSRIGYSSNHAIYASERERWSKMAYSSMGPPAETISLDISAILVSHYLRSVSQGNDIFGDGNIEGAVSKFEEQHSCNKYCEWSGFGLHAFEKQKESGSEDVTVL